MNKPLLKKISIIFFFLAVLTVPFFVLAQPEVGVNYAGNLDLSNGGGQDARVLIINIVRFLLTFVGIVAVVIMMYAGWLWMTSAGDPVKLDKAKKTLIGAIIGLIIIISAFAIVTWIINTINSGLGGGCDPPCAPTEICCAGTCCPSGWNYCCSGVCSATPCSGGIPGVDVFQTTAYTPPDGATNMIRNLRLRVSFNSSVDSATVSLGSGNTFQVTDGGGVDIPGILETVGRRIVFTPGGACGPNPCNATNCFAIGETVNVTVADGMTGILDVGGTSLTCDLAHPCNITFTVGDIIDCQDPVVDLDFAQVCVAPDNELYAQASDDSGVDQIEYFVDGAPVIDIGFPGNPVVNPNVLVNNPFDTYALGLPVIWDGSSYMIGAIVNIRATADDMDAHQGSDSANYRLRPEHCCNGVFDPADGEEGIDCGGPCAGCVGAACGITLDINPNCGGNPDPNCEDTNCASGFCHCGVYPDGPDPFDSCQEKGYDPIVGNTCCVCELSPRINWVAPAGGFCDSDINMPCLDDSDCVGTCNTDDPNGAVGNFFTVGGRFFGDLPGVVTINGLPAPLADTVNPNCTNSWTDTQIIAVVPPGASLGPVRVTEGVTGSNYYDETSYDFVINTIIRPGLCLLTPDNGVIDTLLTYEGIRLTGVSAWFGNYTSSVEAVNSNFPINVSGTALVPNIGAGWTTTFASNTASIYSNYIQFRKNAEPYAGPQITSFDPVQGAPGQYVTIQGTGFGRSKGLSTVHFGDELGPEADYDFPEVCADSVWSDNQVIIKVPAIADALYTITMVLPTEIINTSVLTPNQFNINASLPLLPSACKIEPILSPNNSPVSLWGEYFGAAAGGEVRFHLNYDVGPGLPDITFWAPEGDADKVTAVVDQNAVSGPVQVMQGGTPGNGLNLNIGLCTEASDPDAACGTLECCPNGTYQAGRCAASLDDCYLDILNSVYEWGFSTEFGGGGLGDPCDADTVLPGCQASTTMCAVDFECSPVSCTCVLPGAESCSGYNLSQCFDAYFCPNSPGTCSVYAGNEPEILGSCQFDCDGIGACTAPTCTYNNTIDRCYQNGIDCSLDITVTDTLGQPTRAYCADYSGVSRFHINTSLSCPSGWIMLTGGRCVDMTTTCTLCGSDYICADDYDADTEGLCVINQDICPYDTACTPLNECERIDDAVCECCCDLNAPLYQDCCAPLECLGNCGVDAIPATDTDSFGYCSGCRIENPPGVVDQAASNDACNCSGSSGKFCDVNVDVDGDGTMDGVCRDCAQLTNAADCDVLGVGSCCFDLKDSADVCRGGEGSVIAGGFCPYYNCDIPPNETMCDIVTPIVDGIYGDIPACVTGCAGNASSTGLGLSCSARATTTCDTAICGAPFSCLNDGGGGPIYPDNCGVCCCDPVVDMCNTINPQYPDLLCQEGQAPCSGTGRGLCCGCEVDSHCGNPLALGCGYDACCHARFGVLTTGPVDDEVDVCRNAMMWVEFDTIMDISSFSGNVIVAGDYGASPCPEGTEYLVMNSLDNKKRNIAKRFLARVARGIVKILEPILPSKLAQAYTFPGANNYCAIRGAVDGYNTVAGTSILEFMPNAFLDGDRLYYVIIKGDEILVDQSTGILNMWGVGMNGPMDANNTFNGLTYENSFIWSFLTLSEQSENNGICEISEVEVSPDSYLYQTNRNDSLEDDINPLHITFDTRKDSDKVFTAYPKASDGQILTSLPGFYSWTWTWNIVPASVAAVDLGVLDGVNGNKSLIRVASDITEGQAVVNATAVIDNPSVVPTSPAGTTIPGSANIWFFMCENPWPSITLGTWAPWIDTVTNCTVPLLGCVDTNYELYYCRDTGRVGTYDDLPPMLDSTTVIRGESGPVDDRILKEAFFLRETSPVATSSLTATDDGVGGSVTLNWAAVIDPNVTGYRVYWGRRSGQYDDYADATSPYTVTELDDGRTYYFNITGLYNTGAESDFFGEVTAIPTDSTGPGNVTGFTAIPRDSEIELDWLAVTDADSYQLYYGTSPGVYGFSDNVGLDTGVIVAGLTNANTYYFAIVALDDQGNPSPATSTLISAPFSAPVNLFATASSTDNTVMELVWELSDSGVNLTRIYWGDAPGDYNGGSSPINLPGVWTNFSINGLNPDTIYYFAVASEDTFLNESLYSNEAWGRTAP